MDDSFSSENGQEICTNDGILLRKGPAEFLCEIKNKVTGTLALVHYLKQNTYCIEWKTNDILIADADALEQDEWSFVDTVKKRQRTASETLIFNTAAATSNTNTQISTPILHQQQQLHQLNQFTSLSAAAAASASAAAATAANTTFPSSVNNNNTNTNTTANSNTNTCSVLRVQIYHLKCIEVIKNGHIIKLINRFDGKTHSEYFFQHGNADGFVRSLQQMHCLQRSQHDRFCYEIIDNIEEFDKEKIQKTFAELNITDIKNSKIGREDGGGIRWITGIVRPIGHTIDFLTKMSDAYGVIPNVPGGGTTTTMSTTATTNTTTGEQSINDQTYPRQISPLSYTEDVFNSSYGGSTDEYEVLGTSPKQNDINQHNNNKNNNNNKTNSNNTNNNGISFKELNKQDTMTNDDDVIIKLPIRPEILRGNPLTMKQWKEFFSEDGYVTDIERVKEIIFHGGIEMNVRSDVWKYLLNYYQWNHSEQQREQYQKQKTKEYFKMKLQWLSMNEIQEKNFSGYRDRKCQIEKDVRRTDRTNDFFSGDENPNLILLQDILMTYVMYNFDLGYVQGMSDILAPLLYIVGDEADTFWCFVGFMDIVFNNFDIDQSGMKKQLMNLNKLLSIANPKLQTYFKGHGSENMYFCFRWLLVWFKREFSIGDIMELWECLWTGLPCKNFHLFISVAILDAQMDIFIDNNYEFNEILKHVNELSLKINLKSTLEKAESIYLQIKNVIDNNNNNNINNNNSNSNNNTNNNNDDNNGNNNSNNEINNYNNNYFMIKEKQLIELNNIRIIIGEEPVYNKLKKRNPRNGTNYNNKNNSNNDDKNHHRYIDGDDLNDDDDDDDDDIDDDDNFDDIQILRNFKDEEIYQQKLDEACEKSMYGSYF